jgi:predicted extracellular nuclease
MCISNPRHHVTIALIIAVLFVGASAVQSTPVQAASANIVISQVYGGGGNTGATYTHDFIELFNRGSAAVSVNGWSVQYASATGTGNFGSSTTMITPLPNVSLAPGQYLLIQEASNAAVGSPLPTPDVTDASPIAMSGTAGKVALVNTTTPLGCNGGSTPCSPAQLAQIIDLVGYGNANFFEGAGAAPTLSNTTAAFRAGGGCTDNDNNAADFSAATPAPRNTASPAHYCSGPTNPSGTGAANPNAVFAGSTTLLTVAVTPGANPPSTGLAVAANLSPLGGSATQTLYDNGTNGDAVANDNTFSFLATVNVATTPGAKSLAATITDAQSRSGSTTIALTVQAPLVAIHDIQGASHISPKNNTLVTTTGIVTAKRSNGFYMQDPNPDSNLATSEGLFVYTGSAPAVNVGDAVLVTGTVKEFRPGGTDGLNNLTTTEIDNPGRTVSVQSSGNPLPAATVIGAGGRLPPNMVINDDGTGNVETSGSFDATTDGIDFYESLEGMRVQINNAVAVGPTNAYGEIPVLADNGAGASVRTTRGGIVVRTNDFNPERIILDNEIVATPSVNVGDTFATVVGVMDYSFGNFKLMVTNTLAATSGGLAKETTGAPTPHQLAIATFNVENLDPGDGAAKFNLLAGLIVNNLKSPDILSIEEIQDNNGATNDPVVDATTTWNTLVTAIQAAGGPTYQFRQINPVDDQDGGEPGGNIRVGFLFRTDRGVAFVDRPGGTSTGATSVTGTGLSTQLTFSPGRIDPTNPAFNASRKPLAGEFTFKGDKVFVIANHWNSKGGDQPLFGRFQPPTLSSEVQRVQQATVVKNFVGTILAADPNANTVVLGDLNDFEFSNPLNTLENTSLKTLIETLPQAERYSYVYDGNSQALDHIVVSNAIFARPFTYDSVHLNAEFAVRASDHDPQVARLCVDRTAPALAVSASPNELWPADHKYATVKTSVSATDNADPNPQITLVSVTSNEPDNGLGDGDTPNDIVKVNDTTFNLRAERSGAGSGRVYTITYKVTDACGNTTQKSVTVTVPHSKGNGK